MTTLLDGVTATEVATDRYRAQVLTVDRGSEGTPVVLVHGNVSSGAFFQPLMLELPVTSHAIDLRGFGGSEPLGVDAGRGLRDFSDDVAAVLDAMGIASAHLVGWSMGGGVIMQLLLDRPELVASLTLTATMSPYGVGGTLPDGTLRTPDGAGTGGLGVNQDFVARLAAGDTSDESDSSPRSVFRSAYVAPGYTSEHEDLWVEAMLSTVTGEDNYPGDGTTSEHWPGFAPGTRGVLNTMAPTLVDTSGIVDVAAKPPVLWIHGSEDAIVGDASFFDFCMLGKAGVVPGWPGDEVAPPQPMKQQVRAVLARYAERGGEVTELELPGCGHSPHLERPQEFREALLGLIGSPR